MKSERLLASKWLAATAFVSAVSTPSTLAAQDLASAIDKDTDASRGDIIVTARKREESILKVPVIATVITTEQLESYAVGDIGSVADKVAGLQIGTGVGQNGTQLSLRGVGTTVLNYAIDQPVALNIDGVQMTTANAFKVGMFDLAQVEVLKGPQSLFFGKNSPGGVISLRTADPTDELELIARVSYEFEAREKRIEAIASGPLSPEFGLRLAAYYLDMDGYFYNRAIGIPELGGLTPKYKRFAPNEEYALRGTALWEPSDQFSARLKVNYTHFELQGNTQQMISCPDGTVSLTGIPFLGNGEDCKADRVIRSIDLSTDAFPGIGHNGISVTEFELLFGSAELNYEVADGLTFTSVTGFSDLQQETVYNANFSTASGPTLAVDDEFERREFTQEIRLTSDYPDKPINFMVGGFFQDGTIDYPYDVLGNTFLLGPTLSILDAARHKIDVQAISAFGQILWKVVPNLEISAGARWTDEQRKHKAFNTITGTPVAIPLGRSKISPSNISPEISITYTPTDDLTIFGSYKEGFKSGSFNSSGTPAPGSDNSFDDEKVKGVEGGIKARLFDRTLILNAAAYYYKYSDLQVGAFAIDLENSSFGVKTLNAASAEVYGVDFDLRYLPPQIEGLSLDAAVNWNRARYKKFDNAQCWGGQLISEGCDRGLDPTTGLFNAQDLSGRPLVRAPEWTATAGFDYSVPVLNGLKLGLGSSVRYTSSYYTNFLLRDDMVQDAYFKINARLSIADAEDRWELALIGNNLNDERICGASSDSDFANGVIFPGSIITGGTQRGFGGVNEIACGLERGREIRVRLSAKL